MYWFNEQGLTDSEISAGLLVLIFYFFFAYLSHLHVLDHQISISDKDHINVIGQSYYVVIL